MNEIRMMGVKALYPKLDRPYRFDQGEQRSVPCSALEDGASYEINVILTPEQKKELADQLTVCWKAFAKQEGIKDKPTNSPVKLHLEDGSEWVAKAKLKAAYSGQATNPPRQYDADAKLLPPDFQLTSGSEVNLIVKPIAYKTGVASGVSLRIVAVQVVDLAPAGEGSNPFAPVDGGFKAEFEAQANLHKNTAPASAPPDDFNDDIPFSNYQLRTIA